MVLSCVLLFSHNPIRIKEVSFSVWSSVCIMFIWNHVGESKKILTFFFQFSLSQVLPSFFSKDIRTDRKVFLFVAHNLTDFFFL